MIKRVLFTMLAAVAVASASAQVDFKTVDPAKLIEMGKQQGKLIFVDVYATWCPPCKTMEAQVFSREDVGKFMSEKFVSGKYNIDQTMGKALADTHHIRSIPTYLVFDTEGDLVARLQGSMSAEDFIESLKGVLE